MPWALSEVSRGALLSGSDTAFSATRKSSSSVSAQKFHYSITCQKYLQQLIIPIPNFSRQRSIKMVQLKSNSDREDNLKERKPGQDKEKKETLPPVSASAILVRTFLMLTVLGLE